VLFVHLGALSLEGLQLLELADHVPEVWLEIACIALPLIEDSVVALAGSQELSVKEMSLVDLVLLLPAQRLPLRVLLVVSISPQASLGVVFYFRPVADFCQLGSLVKRLVSHDVSQAIDRRPRLKVRLPFLEIIPVSLELTRKCPWTYL